MRATLCQLASYLALAAVLAVMLAPAAAASPAASQCTLNGTNRADILIGTAGDDVICGRGGNDVIYGAGGNDTIYGDGGKDIIYGDEGNDTIYGNNGRDVIGGGPGNDVIDGGGGPDTLYGGSGYDTINGGKGNDIIHGGGSTNCLVGGPGRNVIPSGARCDPPPAEPAPPVTTPTPTGPTTPVSTAAGTRENPVPLGQAAALHDGWILTVNSVTPDATAAVLAENQFNDPPDPGRQFFIVNISATYTGPGSDSFWDARLEAVGPSAVSYASFADSCGVIPDDFDRATVFTGGTVTGNICWSVRTSDVSQLVMFDDGSFDDDDRVWFKLS